MKIENNQLEAGSREIAQPDMRCCFITTVGGWEGGWDMRLKQPARKQRKPSFNFWPQILWVDGEVDMVNVISSPETGQ